MPALAQSSPRPRLTAAEAPVADAQIVVKDGDTGKLAPRDPRRSARAARRLGPHARAVPGGASPESRAHWSGARGARLTDDFMSFTVVVKRADGKLVELCVEGAETTAKVVESAPQLKPATLPTE